MIADLKPYAKDEVSGLPFLRLFASREEISAEILAEENEAEGLLGDLLGGHAT